MEKGLTDMSATSVRPGILRRIKYKAGFLTVRLVAAAMAVLPDKSFVIGILSLPYGMLMAAKYVSRWRRIARYARIVGTRFPSWLFVPRFFVREAENILWSIALYETEGTICRHVEFEGTELARAAIDGGSGALILGAHYGPAATLRLLYEEGIHAHAFASDRTIKNLKAQAASTCRIPGMKTKRLGFALAPGRLIQARRSERNLIRHVLDGKSIYMPYDLFAYFKGGSMVEFLGSPFRFNIFAFKLALKHKVPVFFIFLRRKRSGSFVLSLKRCEDFQTPLEGLEKYVSELESAITDDPPAWTFLQRYCRWLEQMPYKLQPPRKGAGR